MSTSDDPLFGPGGFFEITHENVRGRTLPVFATRSRSVNELLHNAEAHADNEFCVFSDGRRYTYADMLGAAHRVAASLQNTHDITKGDRVAICAPNGPEWIIAYFATTLAGGIPTAYNGWWTTEEIAHANALTEPALLIVDDVRAARLPQGSPPTVTIGRDFDALLNGDADEFSEPEVDEDEPALILFTSGTTGRPKAATIAHRTIVGFIQTLWALGARAMMATGESPPPNVPLVVMPLFHLSGLYSQLLMTLTTGGRSVWMLGRFDPKLAMDLIETEGANSLAGSSAHLYRVLDHPDFDTFDASLIQRVSVGGAATTPEMIRTQNEKLPHLAGRGSSGYGSTETGAVVSIASADMLAADPTCVGPPIPTIEVMIADDDGNRVPDGVDGNICVRSAYSMLGYWNDPASTEAAFFDDGWLITGDYGQIRNGLTHVGTRTREMIIRGSENIHPTEIEMRLEEHPGVAEVAVIGVDDREMGQRTCAIVVDRPGAETTDDELRSWVAETLASYKVPDHIERRTEPLPRNATGKVDKLTLADER